MASVLNIVRGADKVFYTRIVHKETQEPYDLSTVDEITLLLPKSDEAGGGALQKKLSDADGSVSVLSDGHVGKVQFKLTEVETTDLKVGEELSFEVEVRVNDITSVVQFSGVLNVIARLF